MAIQSRGPWLAKGLCCPFGSLLTMASSEALASFCCLIFFVQQVFALRFRMGWMREIPQFTLRICNFVPSSVPRRLSQVQTVVPSLRVLAFVFSVEAQQSAFLCRRFSHRRVTRLQSSRQATARSLASPSPTRTFTFELSSAGSPLTDVDYNYVVKQPITTAGLAPARYAALWAADRDHREPREIKPGPPAPARASARRVVRIHLPPLLSQYLSLPEPDGRKRPLHLPRYRPEYVYLNQLPPPEVVV